MKILVVDKNFLGDMLLDTPGFRALANIFRYEDQDYFMQFDYGKYEASARLYLWLKLKGLSHRWAMWIAHPIERLREWLYWRDILLLPWEGFGWELNTKRNRDRRKLKEVEGKRFSGADV